MKVTVLIFLFCTAGFIQAQSKVEKDINSAYVNAKKGVYWALSNIPESKSRLNEDLIAGDKLYASVKLDKEIDGIKIESTGFDKMNSVQIIIYKSNDVLKKEGYLKSNDDKKSEK